ncbi:hypothetical protein EGW08_000678, partial [Elysia chlorotica]
MADEGDSSLPPEHTTSETNQSLMGKSSEDRVGSADSVSRVGSQEAQDNDAKKSLVEEMKSISIVDVIKPISEIFDPDKYPPSYKEYSDKENKALKYCKTFIKQYNFLFDRRRPLFLKPKNVFGVEKLVCTTLKPGQLPYKDLLDWPGIAEFVAGYVDYDVLRPPHMLPKVLHAPRTTLDRLHGHCFDISTLLCSMLIGAGYDAFVVSGYATREVCLRDLSYTKCPFVEDDQKVYLPLKQRKVCRYTPRAPRLFRSEY